MDITMTETCETTYYVYYKIDADTIEDAKQLILEGRVNPIDREWLSEDNVIMNGDSITDTTKPPSYLKQAKTKLQIKAVKKQEREQKQAVKIARDWKLLNEVEILLSELNEVGIKTIQNTNPQHLPYPNIRIHYLGNWSRELMVSENGFRLIYYSEKSIEFRTKEEIIEYIITNII